MAKVEESWQSKYSELDSSLTRKLKSTEHELSSFKESVSFKMTQFEQNKSDLMRYKIRTEELEVSNKEL